MAHVGVHRLATGDGQKCRTDNGKADVEVLVDQEIERIERAEGGEHGGRLDDAVDAERGQHREPADHDRAECPPDKSGALPLYDEQPDQDHNRERHDGRRKRRRVGLQSFDGAEHRDRRRNRAVTIEQGGADEAHHQQFRAPCSGLRMARVEQRQQRDDAAFAAVVRAQDQKRVFDRDDEDQRPQDQRHHAEDGFIRQRSAMGGGLGGFLQGVEGAGADVAVDDTKGAERGCCGELSGMAGGCNWRTRHWRPHWHRARRISRGARSTASLRRDAANCHGVPIVGKPFVLRRTVDENAGIDEVLGGHPEDLKPEQSGGK